MRHTRLIVLFAALLLGACGGTQQANQPAAQPAAIAPTTAPVPTSAPALTAAPTEGVLLNESSVPAPSEPPAVAAATTNPPLPTEPTSRLILPAGTPIPATGDVARATSTPAAGSAAPVPPRATSAPAAQPADTAGTSEPVRIVIQDIGLDGRMVSVGLDENRIPVVPKHNVGWYNLSAHPGQGENIVLWGHVLRFREAPNIPAPFGRLKEVKPGAAVLLYDKAGKTHK
ncbi:MAG TPA: sortase, partial [Roseiflexaceae bacterium]